MHIQSKPIPVQLPKTKGLQPVALDWEAKFQRSGGKCFNAVVTVHSISVFCLLTFRIWLQDYKWHVQEFAHWEFYQHLWLMWCQSVQVFSSHWRVSSIVWHANVGLASQTHCRGRSCQTDCTTLERARENMSVKASQTQVSDGMEIRIFLSTSQASPC